MVVLIWFRLKSLSQTDDAAFAGKIRSSDLLTSAHAPFMWSFNCTAGSISSDYAFPFCSFFHKQPLVVAELMMQHTNRPHPQRNTVVGSLQQLKADFPDV